MKFDFSTCPQTGQSAIHDVKTPGKPLALCPDAATAEKIVAALNLTGIDIVYPETYGYEPISWRI